VVERSITANPSLRAAAARRSSSVTVAHTFSADGQTIYGIREAAADRLELFSMSVPLGTEQTIGVFGHEHLPETFGLGVPCAGRQEHYLQHAQSLSNLWLIELNGVTPR
jgi:hypothetical protein